MSTTDNGAIDYRKRIQARKDQQLSQPVSLPVPPATEDAATTSEPTAVSVEPVIVAEPVVPVVDVSTAGETAMSRTPQAVREQAKAAVVHLLRVTEAEYTAMMTQLSETDPILYAAVVDEINDARAAETKTA